MKKLISFRDDSLPSLEEAGGCSGFTGRLLRAEDVPRLIFLRRAVIRSLSDPDLYVLEDDEEAFLRQHCGEEGETYGVFSGEDLVAYGAVGFPPAESSDNLGRVMGLCPVEWGNVAHIASCMVLPVFRGHGLQRALLRARFEMAMKAGRRYAIAMVSPKNHESRHNMLMQGMCVGWAGTLSPGLNRQLLWRDLASPHAGAEIHEASTPERVLAEDLVGQREAIARGLVGVREFRDSKGVWLDFVPRGEHMAPCHYVPR